jgi:hypothetical protein
MDSNGVGQLDVNNHEDVRIIAMSWSQITATVHDDVPVLLDQ